MKSADSGADSPNGLIVISDGRGGSRTAPSVFHRRRSIRLQGYDYTQAGAYFVTICTQDPACLFGEVADGQMRSNDAGRVVADSWQWLALQYDYVELDEWVVMTGSASDPLHSQPHIRNKDRREALAVRFRLPAGQAGDQKDPCKIVIVRDMWLTGFDCPSLHTMYSS